MIREGFAAASEVSLVAARAMVLESSRVHDRGEDILLLAACCKLFTSEALGRVVDRNGQVHGGAGYVGDYPAERHYRDARLARIYEGTSQIQQLVIARNVTRAAQAALA